MVFRQVVKKQHEDHQLGKNVSFGKVIQAAGITVNAVDKWLLIIKNKLKAIIRQMFFLFFFSYFGKWLYINI